MPLLVIIVALLIPRVTILLLYFFTNWFQGVFSNLLLPILGFIFYRRPCSGILPCIGSAVNGESSPLGALLWR